MTQEGYFKDMSIIDGRLTSCEGKLEELKIVLRKILDILSMLKEAQIATLIGTSD